MTEAELNEAVKAWENHVSECLVDRPTGKYTFIAGWQAKAEATRLSKKIVEEEAIQQDGPYQNGPYHLSREAAEGVIKEFCAEIENMRMQRKLHGEVNEDI